MKLGIIACDILKPEIEFLTKDDPDFVIREYLEFALHEYPKDMKNKVIERGGIPFYGTAAANVFSQSIASNSGFRPAWVETAAKPIGIE